MSAMPIALGELDLDEVLRYMGTPPSQAGPELRALAEEGVTPRPAAEADLSLLTDPAEIELVRHIG